jgi:hypothetical protein
MEAAQICGKGRLYIQVCLDHRRYTPEWGGSLSRSPESCLGIHFLRTRLPLGRITKRQPGIGGGSARRGGKDRGRPPHGGGSACSQAKAARRVARFSAARRGARDCRAAGYAGGASHLPRAVAAIQATNCRPSMRAISGGILVGLRACGRTLRGSIPPLGRDRAGRASLPPSRRAESSPDLGRVPPTHAAMPDASMPYLVLEECARVRVLAAFRVMPASRRRCCPSGSRPSRHGRSSWNAGRSGSVRACGRIRGSAASGGALRAPRRR